MHNNEFEKQVQQKMEELKLTPRDAVWENVEASLPEKNKRRWLLWLFSIVIVGTAIVFFLNQNTNDKAGTAKTADSTGKNQPKEIAVNNERASANVEANPTDDPNSATELSKVASDSFTIILTTNEQLLKDKIKDQVHIPGSKIAIKNVNNQYSDNDNHSFVSRNKKIAHKAVKTKVTIRTSQGGEDLVAEDGVPVIPDTQSSITNKESNKESTSNIVDSSAKSIEESGNNRIIKPVGEKPNELPPPSNGIATKKLVKGRWNYSLTAGVGTSNTGEGISLKKMAYDVAFSTLPGNGQTSRTVASRPTSGKTFEVAILASRNLNAKWNFKTGLGYSCLSTNIKVGSRFTDSAALLSLNNGNTSGTYYPGDTFSYKNNFHVLEIPMLFQYKISKHLPIYIEAGSSLGYLLSSNALVYSNSTGKHYTNKDIFNQLLISLQAGVGVDLAKKTKFPFSIGYRLRSDISSAIKTSVDKQYLNSSIIYLKVPLKK